MMRSLFAGVSGLRNHQVRMDVIGNNIANVNTVGFKAGRATFKEMLSQLMAPASAPQGGRGGTNPLQVGLGVSLASIDTLHEKGNLEPTGINTDLAIDGAGFFLVSDGSRTYCTRAGAFSWDDQYNLVTPSGLKVMGWLAEGGTIPSSRTGVNLKPISLADVQSVPARATTTIGFAKNLDAGDMGTFTLSSSSLDLKFDPDPMVANDEFTRKVTFELLPTSEFNTWRWHLAGDGVTFTVGGQPASDGYLEFDGDQLTGVTGVAGDNTVTVKTKTATGAEVETKLVFPTTPTSKSGWELIQDGAPAGSGITATYGEAQRATSISVVGAKGESYSVVTTFTKVDDNTWNWSAAVKGPAGEDLAPTQNNGQLKFKVDGSLETVNGDDLKFGITGYKEVSVSMDFARLTQYATDYTALAADQNGYGPGDLMSVTVDAKGIVMGSYSNAMTSPLAQVALASFSNPGGLVKRGDTLFEQSANSGEAQIGDAGTGGRGTIAPGSLEMANVDLAQEFTNLVITQRGFQANSRIITTADEMLQDLVNLKR